MKFLALCWRDLWRNRRRTMLTGLVMVFAVAVMILFVGLGDGAHLQMIRSATDSFLGHVQVQRVGYLDEPSLEKRLTPDEITTLGALLPTVAGVRASAPRLTTGGLVSKKVPDPADAGLTGEALLDAYRQMSSEGAFLVGVDPPAERAVSTLADSVMADDPAARCLAGCRAGRAEVFASLEGCDELCAQAGQGFAGDACLALGQRACEGRCPADDELCDVGDCRQRFDEHCEPARFLADADPQPDQPYRGEVVLGAGLARVLEVGVGDRVALTTGTADGRSFASLYRVVGLIRTGSLDINRTFALTHRDKLARGLGAPGGASAVVVAIDDREAAPHVAGAITRAWEGRLSGLRALPWQTLSPELVLFIQIDQGSLLVMLAMMIMVVGVIVANIVTMSVMERTREYGVRLALGESPSRIAWGLVVETQLLGLAAGALGGLVGEALNLTYQVHGIDFGMGEIETTGVLISTVYHTEVTLYGVVFSLVTVLGFSLLGSLYPAWRIRRLRPVDALRFV